MNWIASAETCAKCRYAIRRLWGKPIPVAWIEDGLPHIRKIQNLTRQALQANRKSAMRRHSQIEHGEMALEIGRVDRSGAQCDFQVLATMQSLSARRDFDPLEDEIETRCRASITARRGVERPGRQREAEDEDCGYPCFSLRPSTK